MSRSGPGSEWYMRARGWWWVVVGVIVMAYGVHSYRVERVGIPGFERHTSVTSVMHFEGDAARAGAIGVVIAGFGVVVAGVGREINVAGVFQGGSLVLALGVFWMFAGPIWRVIT